jgi:hypothetical protein
MRRFCRWLVTEGEVDNAPTDGIQIATAPDKPVPILTDVESTALLKTCAVGRGRPGTFARPIFLGRRGQTVSWRELLRRASFTDEKSGEVSYTCCPGVDRPTTTGFPLPVAGWTPATSSCAMP